MFGLSNRDLFASGTGLLLVGPLLEVPEAELVEASFVRAKLGPAAHLKRRRGGTGRPEWNRLDPE